MGDYWGLLVVLAVGVPLLLLAGWADSRRARQAADELACAPERGNETVDALTPAYVTQDEVDAMPAPGGAARPTAERSGKRFTWGMAHPDFATATDAAEYEDIRVLVVDGEVEAFRQLLVPVGRCSNEAPLAVVATGFHPEVLQTLAANRRATGLPVVAAVAAPEDLEQVAAITGAELLEPEDLIAGYAPEGTATAFVCTTEQTWIKGTEA